MRNDGPTLFEARSVRDELDTMYAGLNNEQQQVVDAAADRFSRTPLRTLLAMFGPAASWRAWRTREIWTNDEVCRYAAIIATSKTLDPTKGTGRGLLLAAKTSVMKDG